MILLHPVENLLLNLSSGLDIKDLTKKEVALLERHYGKDWKLKLGYQTNLEYLEEKARAKDE